jgi:hypothetical protein
MAAGWSTAWKLLIQAGVCCVRGDWLGRQTGNALRPCCRESAKIASGQRQASGQENSVGGQQRRSKHVPNTSEIDGREGEWEAIREN